MFGLSLMLVLIAIYSLLRGLFLTFNFSAYANYKPNEFLTAFVYGIRFDVAAIFLINLVFLAIWYSPWPKHKNINRTFSNYMMYFFMIINGIGIALNLVDLDYYRFTGRRSTFIVFKLSQDISSQFVNLAMSFWHLSIILTIILYVLSKVYRYYEKKFASENNQDQKTKLITLVALLVLGGLGIRGGLQRKPLNVAHALGTDTKISHLTLNTTFTMLKSSTFMEVSRLDFFPDLAAARQAIEVQKEAPAVIQQKKQNVVILILESFGREYLGVSNPYEGFTPFFDSLARDPRSLYFENGMANGRRSIEAPPSILAGIPSLMDDPYMTSAYQGNKIVALPSLLKQHGYKSSFYHGGKNGSMYFDVFAKIAGISDYVGLNEYPYKDRDYDGTWGIYDDRFLNFFADELNKKQGPFLATLFTVSSHNPYKMPEEFRDRFKGGSLPIHPSIRYVDYSLQEFFKKVESMPWYKDTLFVITGDHTSLSGVTSYQESIGLFRVPILLFHPSIALPKVDTKKIAQHADIPKTVLHFLDIYPKQTTDQQLLPFGHSLLDPTFSGRAINQINRTYLLTCEDHVMEWNIMNPHKFRKILGDQLLPDADVATENQQKKMQQLIMGFAQYFNNGLLDNGWF